ncbi:MAG: hypothetical protein, partial [Olavius algarvensis Gamma 1 endosymbiont]
WRVESTRNGEIGTEPLPTAWKSVPGSAFCPGPAGPTPYRVFPRGSPSPATGSAPRASAH